MLRRCLLPLAQATAPAARTSTVRRLSSAPLPRAAASSSSSSSSGSASSSQSADVSRPFARAHRDLPPLASSSRRLGVTLLLGGATLASWLLFTAHATNRERLGSSVLKATLERVRCDEHVQQTLGAKEAAEVKLKRSSWLFGDAWVGGAINMMQGRVDMSFVIKGPSNDEATVHFHSVRRSSASPFEITRFYVEPKDGKKARVELLDEKSRVYDAEEGFGA